jgi:NtrC-family two-component system response regulator AlgB
MVEMSRTLSSFQEQGTSTSAGDGAMNILVVDDETNIRKAMSLYLEAEGHKVVSVSNAADARSEAARRAFDLAFVDLNLGSDKGMDLIPQLLAQSPWMKVIVITGFASVDVAVQSMKTGASDLLSKPFSPVQIKQVAQRVAQVRLLERKIRVQRGSDIHQRAETDIEQTNSPAMQRALHLARQVAATDVTVLIRGESGTGKKTLARAIHHWSKRVGAPVNVIPCQAFNATSLTEELFGRVDGDELTPGRIAGSDGGTLILDEVGDTPMNVQSQLLRFVRDREYENVDGTSVRKADVRLITTTSRDLGSLAQARAFREDLLYRLNVIQIELPALRERPEDVMPMAEEFLAFFAKQGRGKPLGFSNAAAEALRRYAWPGNIHELRNVVERCAILGTGDILDVEHLPPGIVSHGPAPVEPGAMISLEKIEELHIRRILAATKSLEEAAGILGIDTATLWRRRKKYGI